MNITRRSLATKISSYIIGIAVSMKLVSAKSKANDWGLGIDLRAKPIGDYDWEKAQLIKAKQILSEQDALEVIDHITGDDFCEELDLTPNLTGDLKIAHEKLSMIYRVAHSMNRTNSCYPVHDAWRKEVQELSKNFRESASNKQ